MNKHSKHSQPRQARRFCHQKISMERGLILQIERALHEQPGITTLALDLSTIAAYTQPIGSEFANLDEAYDAVLRCGERHHIDVAILIDGLAVKGSGAV
jgi:hypothetical protein